MMFRAKIATYEHGAVTVLQPGQSGGSSRQRRWYCRGRRGDRPRNFFSKLRCSVGTRWNVSRPSRANSTSSVFALNDLGTAVVVVHRLGD